MLGANQIYQEMTHVEQRYEVFRKLFKRFEDIVTSGLTANDCPVKSIKIESQGQVNEFYAHFAGKCVRYAFSMERDEQGGLRGQVKCTLVDPITKDKGAEVATFSFNGQGETKLKLAGDGDAININHDAHAAYFGLHMLFDALGKH